MYYDIFVLYLTFYGKKNTVNAPKNNCDQDSMQNHKNPNYFLKTTPKATVFKPSPTLHIIVYLIS